ncbi:MAG: protein phosphatase 2C domain-containing protein [Lachnospiraceae bacterium]|nr:protein phosphatase 2C domain-containing protein [Lachnospiraceae bacterium]
MQCYINSNKGSFRSDHEDNFICMGKYLKNREHSFAGSVSLQKEKWNLCGVFDGMGGTEQGEVASLFAAEEFFRCQEKMKDRSFKEKDAVDRLLRDAFLRTNNRIVETIRYSGTTATVLVLGDSMCKVYHLGDSRAFLIRDGSIRQLTKDQTVETMKLEMGLQDQIREADRHRLTEFLGADETMQGILPVESEWMSIEEKDCFVLCTDGLYEGCTPREILDTVLREKQKIQEKIAALLVESALRNKVKDNVTCLVIC